MGGGEGGRGGRGGGKGFGHGEEIASAVDFKRHIEALHYLLQLWPGETGGATEQETQERTFGNNLFDTPPYF